MRFSCVNISSRRVKTVEPSCGTNAIGALLVDPSDSSGNTVYARHR